MFKTTQANIPQIKATIKAFGECWFHGCGNMYADKSASDFRQKFTNPNSEESSYRIHFTSIAQVPVNVEDLNKKLMSSRSEEIVREKMPKVAQEVKTISVEDDEDVPKKVGKKGGKPAPEPDPAVLTDEEKEFQRLLAEENAAKGL
jgi:hypothetical protein